MTRTDIVRWALIWSGFAICLYVVFTLPGCTAVRVASDLIAVSQCPQKTPGLC